MQSAWVRKQRGYTVVSCFHKPVLMAPAVSVCSSSNGSGPASLRMPFCVTRFSPYDLGWPSKSDRLGAAGAPPAPPAALHAAVHVVGVLPQHCQPAGVVRPRPVLVVPAHVPVGHDDGVVVVVGDGGGGMELHLHGRHVHLDLVVQRVLRQAVVGEGRAVSATAATAVPTEGLPCWAAWTCRLVSLLPCGEWCTLGALRLVPEGRCRCSGRSTTPRRSSRSAAASRPR